MRRVVALVLTAGLLAAPAAALARCPRTSLPAMENQVMCPVCGTSLALAGDAPLAQRERALISRLVRRCRSEDQIKATLRVQFGDEVLAAPRGDGFGLSAYLVPLALLLVGAGVVTATVTQLRRRPAPRDLPAPPALVGDDAQRLAAELERLRS